MSETSRLQICAAEEKYVHSPDTPLAFASDQDRQEEHRERVTPGSSVNGTVS